MTINLNDPSIVIVIDLWTTVNPVLVRKIVTFINNNNFIEDVYGGIYGVHSKARKIHPYIKELSKPFDNISTKYEILGEKRQWDVHELRLRCLDKKPHIKNIYITGTHWKECVKDRSLGYPSIKKHFPDKNVIINTLLVQGFMEEDIQENYAYWSKIDKDNYLYHPPQIKSISSINKQLYHQLLKLKNEF